MRALTYGSSNAKSTAGENEPSALLQLTPFPCVLWYFKHISLMCYTVGLHAFPLPFPSVFRKFEVWERFMPKIGGGGTPFPCVLWHFNHWFYTKAIYTMIIIILLRNILKRHYKIIRDVQSPTAHISAPECNQTERLCLSVHLSHANILSKLLHISSNFFTIW